MIGVDKLDSCRLMWFILVYRNIVEEKVRYKYLWFLFNFIDINCGKMYRIYMKIEFCWF